MHSSLHPRQSTALPLSSPSTPPIKPQSLPAPRLTPALQTYSLRDNYRSSERIVRTADALISANLDWQRAGLQPLLGLGEHIEVREQAPPPKRNECSLCVLYPLQGGLLAC